MVAGAIFSSALYHFSGGIASIMAEKRAGSESGQQRLIAVLAGRPEFKHGALQRSHLYNGNQWFLEQYRLNRDRRRSSLRG